MQLIVVSGLSGAGKSTALDVFEDMGFFCIDNLPLSLLEPLATEHGPDTEGPYARVAVGVDARGTAEDLARFPALIADLRSRGIEAKTLFLTADKPTLLRRYSETRRRHPLSGPDLPLPEALEAEKVLLEPIADVAEVNIDTSLMNLHELREVIRTRLANDLAVGLTILFRSFGFKYGRPTDLDFMFDVRCLPNPHWDPALKPLTGRDQAVADFLGESELVRELRHDIQNFLERWLPQFERSDRSYVTIGIGCTGGRHRSVYLAEQLAAHFSERFSQVLLRHSELG